MHAAVNLAEVLRYAMSSVVILVYRWLFDPYAVARYLEGSEFGLVAGIALALGAACYVVYRALLYPVIVIFMMSFTAYSGRTVIAPI